jgi:hypothetical protein
MGIRDWGLELSIMTSSFDPPRYGITHVQRIDDNKKQLTLRTTSWNESGVQSLAKELLTGVLTAK